MLCVVPCPLALTRLVTDPWWRQWRNGGRALDAKYETESGGGGSRFDVREENERSRCGGAHGRKGANGKRGRTEARMLTRMRRRPWTWASWCESCSIEDGWEEVSVGLCD